MNPQHVVPECTPETTPVIVGVGEFIDRPAQPADAREPLDAIAEALHAADRDAGGGWIDALDSLHLVAFITWRYDDPARQLCERLGIDASCGINGPMGGESPIRAIHDAALRIARGEIRAAAVAGGEAMSARTRARKDKIALPWTPLAAREQAVAFPTGDFALSPIAKRLGVTDPAQVYPLYEMATQAAWGQTPAQAQEESAQLWARYAAVAADNPGAWLRKAPDAATIATVDDANRMINWPYPKLMVANPQVNQSAAVIVTSLAQARRAGIPDTRIVHIWGGAAANEPADYLQRDDYGHSTAQAAVLRGAVELVGGDAQRFGPIELYSCFPVVPKMALRTLGLDAATHAPSVAGGLTFFGGPLNNYMSHAVCAMVRALREAPDRPGLLYGQGGYVNKHHALVVGMQPAPQALAPSYSVQSQAEASRASVPALIDGYEGPARIETYTVLYGRDGRPLHGIVVLRTPDEARLMAKVAADDEASMARLLSTQRNAVGEPGHVRIDTFGHPVWEAGEARRDRSTRALRYCSVEREGHVTVVTINRPDSMNALTPAANAELAEVFDDFARDPAQWVAILTGAGERAFCSGNDLKFTAQAMARGESIEPPLTGFAGLTSRFDLNKPVIAAVNGVAMGGGFEIALACDLIVAAENAVFALPEPKVGLAALAGGLLRLPRQIGLKQAMGLILTGRRVTAAEGLALGFVNETTAAGGALDAARRWADEIVGCSPMSVRASMEVLRSGLQSASVKEAYAQQNRLPAVRALFKSDDVREGPLAFAQKRAPVWRAE
ncbi:enoyl-CoA hydratase-related protein [Paraburkholderia bannensis]|uniref:enoyl-CoA hydratase-related protein n=1 Tax=Paraburkholderia bannensis TaxID=765414 RepID=UPI002AC35B72|nr:enoyl-CoA hydratase-related protein [Paraburkholderia bannensis]